MLENTLHKSLWYCVDSKEFILIICCLLRLFQKVSRKDPLFSCSCLHMATSTGLRAVKLQLVIDDKMYEYHRS